MLKWKNIFLIHKINNAKNLFKIIETQNPRSTMEGSQKLTNKLFCKNLVTPMNFF